MDKENKSEEKSKKISSPEIKKIIESFDDKTMLCDVSIDEITKEGGLAYNIADALKKDLSHTQLRNYYAYIKNADRKHKNWDDIESQLLLLKPRLASKFVQEKIPYGFYEFMDFMIEKINQVSEEKCEKSKDECRMENFERFVQLFESVVAYHKYLEGGE